MFVVCGAFAPERQYQNWHKNKNTARITLLCKSSRDGAIGVLMSRANREYSARRIKSDDRVCLEGNTVKKNVRDSKG